MAGEREAALRLLNQSIAMPSRNIDPTLRIKRESTAALKHPFTPLKYTKTYFSPLYANGFSRSSANYVFFNGNKGLDDYLKFT